MTATCWIEFRSNVCLALFVSSASTRMTSWYGTGVDSAVGQAVTLGRVRGDGPRGGGMPGWGRREAASAASRFVRMRALRGAARRGKRSLRTVSTSVELSKTRAGEDAVAEKTVVSFTKRDFSTLGGTGNEIGIQP